MDPNQNVNVAGAAGAAPVQSSPSAPVASENIMAQGVSEKKKGGKGMLYGMILCAILAIGGIGFGIWAWMDGNTQKDSLNQQISELKKQNNELLEKLNNNALDGSDSVDDENEEGEVVTIEWPVRGGVFGNKFYIMDSTDKIIIKDDNIQVSEVTSCDIPVGPDASKIMTCGVKTIGDGDGVFFYDGVDDVLEYYDSAEWNEKWQEVVNRH